MIAPRSSKVHSCDHKIIRALQHIGHMSIRDLSAEVDPSPSPCFRRMRNPVREGVIKGCSIDVDAAAYGLPVMVFVRVSLETHSENSVINFENRVQAIPDVLGCFVMTGLSDGPLRAVVSEHKDHERFFR